jgi:hypothetical protein
VYELGTSVTIACDTSYTSDYQLDSGQASAQVTCGLDNKWMTLTGSVFQCAKGGCRLFHVSTLEIPVSTYRGIFMYGPQTGAQLYDPENATNTLKMNAAHMSLPDTLYAAAAVSKRGRAYFIVNGDVDKLFYYDPLPRIEYVHRSTSS